MTTTTAHPRAGGSYIRQPDGRLTPEEAPESQSAPEVTAEPTPADPETTEKPASHAKKGGK